MPSPSATHRSSTGYSAHPRFAQAPARIGFTATELLVVIAIIVVLMSLLLPLVGILKESNRRQHARRVVAQLEMGVRAYAAEDPMRSPPPAEADHLVRYDVADRQMHLMNALTAMQLDAGLQVRAPDPADDRLRVLIDPWGRPYRYQVDDAGGSDPTQKVPPTRPDPAKLDWNSKNLVPYGYAWSLGRPLHGERGQWTNDPDAVAGSGAPWIYPISAPGAP